MSAPTPGPKASRLWAAILWVPGGAALAAVIAAPLAWVASGFLPGPSTYMLLGAFTFVGALGGLGIALFREDGVERRTYLPPEERGEAPPAD